jgi:AcrR family transcriptional regulator
LVTPRTSAQSEKIREERRRQLLEAALAVFAERGYHATRVSDIAARAGVSQGTVYWYFNSKGDLYQAAFMHYLDVMTEPLSKLAARQDLSPQARLMAIAEASLNMLDEGAGLLMLSFQAMSTPETAKLLTAGFRDAYRRWIEMCTPLFQAIGDPDPRTAAQLFIGVLDALMFQYILDPTFFDREQVLAAIKHKFRL